MLSFDDFLLEKKTDTIAVFDIDDTLLTSNNNIYITEPGKKEYAISTEDFADMRVKLPKETKFDYRDFKRYETVYFGIKGGKPNLKVLKLLDEHVSKGDKIGVITARAVQDAAFRGLKNFLLYKKDDDSFAPLPKTQFDKKYIFAVNDPKTIKMLSKHVEDISPENPSAAKAYILKEIFGNMMGFKNIYFYDDDKGNIDKTKSLNDPRIKAILV